MRNVFIVLALAAPMVWAQEMVRGTVAGRPVTQAELEALMGQVPEQLKNAMSGNTDELLRYYGFVCRLAEMAEKAKLGEQSPYKEQLDLHRKTVLAAAAASEKGKDLNVSTAAVEKYYEEHKDAFTTANVTIVQVPVKSEAD